MESYESADNIQEALGELLSVGLVRAVVTEDGSKSEFYINPDLSLDEQVTILSRILTEEE